MLEIALAIAFVLFLMAVVFAACRPHLILYALAAVVSLVGLNVHYGGTLYLSRIVILFFFVATLLRLALNKPVALPFRDLPGFVGLFGLILFFQMVSVIFSDRISDGLTQVLIYSSAMTIFVVVIIAAEELVVIINAMKIYLVAGLGQGVYGVYQLIGPRFNWPTYQTMMEGIPTANDRTSGGYLYSGDFQLFKSTGFFPGDVSHYAGYMVGILLIGITFLVYNPKQRPFWLYLTMFFGSIGLFFSFSRSGYITLIVFGLPFLFFVLSRVSGAAAGKMRSVLSSAFLVLVVAGSIASQVWSDSFVVDLPIVMDTLAVRFADLLAPEVNSSGGGSMGEHIETRLIGLQAFASSPVIGVGLGVNASPWFPTPTAERAWAGSHSHHLDILGQTGLIGAGLQFLLMVIVGKYMWRGLLVTRDPSLGRHLLAGILAAYTAILLGNFLYSYFLNDFVWFLMGIGVALSRLLIADARRTSCAAHNASPRPNSAQTILGCPTAGIPFSGSP